MACLFAGTGNAAAGGVPGPLKGQEHPLQEFRFHADAVINAAETVASPSLQDLAGLLKLHHHAAAGRGIFDRIIHNIKENLPDTGRIPGYGIMLQLYGNHLHGQTRFLPPAGHGAGDFTENL